MRRPDGARMLLWIVVNLGHRSIDRVMPRSLVSPPMGQGLERQPMRRVADEAASILQTIEAIAGIGRAPPGGCSGATLSPREESRATDRSDRRCAPSMRYAHRDRALRIGSRG